MVSIGDSNFYSKTGFKFIPQDRVKAPYKLGQLEGWLGQSTQGNNLEKIVEPSQCVVAFDNFNYW